MIQLLSDALASRGYDTLTPVQEAVTDPALVEADLLVSAQTGSGKTVAFGLAIGPTLMGGAVEMGPAGAPLALIVAPTRELAFQVMRELTWLYAATGATVTACVGGMDMRDERRALERGAHIVVGTPGRLVDHIKRRSLDMSGLRAVVLDEADEMLDLGFREDLEFMLGEAPAERRTLMFSATVPPMIAGLAASYQRDAVRVETRTDTRQHADIAYQALRVAQADAENAIVNVLRFHDAENAIVFANTRATVARLTTRLSNRGFAVVSLSGELSQSERSHALQAMRDGRARVCVATDVAARGIDLPGLDLVIHAELPSNTEGLLHRSGRTGRAGRKGLSALIVPPKVAKKAQRLLIWAKIDAEWREAPGADEILARDEERLLADATWTGEITEAEGAFADKLLAQVEPRAVAAAYMRLFRSRVSAPEDLLPADTRPERPERPERKERAERAPFGPSVWIALSVGRNERAEPRWLLPLLLKTGNMDKSAIGAIRVQETETFVEMTEAAAPGFMAAQGEGGVVEKDMTARRLDGPPDLGRSAPAGKPERKDRAGRPERTERPERPERTERKDRPNSRPNPTDAAPTPAPVSEAAPAVPGSEPVPDRDKAQVTPFKPARAKTPADRPRKDMRGTGDRPAKAPYAGKSEGKPPFKARSGSKPGHTVTSDGAPAHKGKPGAKPWKRAEGGAGKPAGPRPDGAKPWKGKPGGKPAGKPGPAKFSKPARPAANPSDTSKRFKPPKAAGGNAPPKRPK